MVRSRLPLEERIFVPRDLPAVIILSDGEAIPGPFCVNCGNPRFLHRDDDYACPARRLHPLMPRGARETCSCTQYKSGLHSYHHPECNLLRYRYNGTVTP